MLLNLIILIILLIFRFSIKKKFITLDYHSLFRSFFCFGISMGSIGTSIIYWDDLVINPLSSNIISNIINNFMLEYMVLDLIYFFYSNKIRPELIFHHIISGILYYFGSNYIILTFCSICEILSAFNWISILFPNYEWAAKIFRLFAILFIRLWIWLFTISLFYKYKSLFYFVFLIVSLFICLDCYWLYIIYSNYIKYLGFIKQNIKSKINKKKSSIIKNFINKKTK